ncbi:hypothetical protein EAF00_004075 [Botryotinia globosa]|nr:hypothetical protein EAF00_004075 [Botryotinia globosa]
MHLLCFVALRYLLDTGMAMRFSTPSALGIGLLTLGRYVGYEGMPEKFKTIESITNWIET